MFTRIVTSAVIGVTVTTGLIYLMHYLVAVSGGASSDQPKMFHGVFLRTVKDTPVVVDRDDITEPLPPPVLPEIERVTDVTDDWIAVRPARVTPGTPRIDWRLATKGQVDGGLMTIVAVQPTYPAIAAERGLEGHVIVSFDVDELGAVQNIAVVETTNRLFNNSAKKAVSRFKFKPKVVDGVPQASFGVRRMFTFRMEKD